jgi:hypothetical protein
MVRFHNATISGFLSETGLLESTVAQAVKISDPEMEVLREAAATNSRSISGQAEHWLRIGRAVERDPRFGYVQIEQALKGLRPVSSLNDEQQEEFFERFAAETLVPTERERAFWEERQRKGLGVGMDEEGNIVQPGH